MSATDGEIVLLSLTDPPQFATLFDRHIYAVRRFVTRRLGGLHADDVVSEVFRVAFERRAVFDVETKSALPWLYGIAANLIRRQYRDDLRQAAVLERVDRRFEATEDPYGDLAARVDAPSELDGLRRAVVSLPKDEREILLMVAWDQLSPTEVATILGIPPATVRTRLHRARQHVRRFQQEHDTTKEPITDA